MGSPWFVLPRARSLVPNFSLIINAPNAIRNDLAGAPIDWVKFWAYSDSNSDHGISWAIITQQLSEANFPPWGNSKLSGAVPSGSTFRYTTVNGSAKVLCYFSPRRCTRGSISSSSKACCVTLGLIIQQALFILNYFFAYQLSHLSKHIDEPIPVQYVLISNLLQIF